MNACPRCERMRLRCPESRPSYTKSSPGQCTACGTVSCNLVYIGCDAYADLRPRGPLRNLGVAAAYADATRPGFRRSERARLRNRRSSECKPRRFSQRQVHHADALRSLAPAPKVQSRRNNPALSSTRGTRGTRQADPPDPTALVYADV